MSFSAETVARCRRLVGEIDATARESGAYEVERRWTNPAGALVYDPGYSAALDQVTAEFLCDLPRHAAFFTGWNEEALLDPWRRVVWRTASVLSPVFALKALTRLGVLRGDGGPPPELIDTLASAHARGLPASYRCADSFDGTRFDRLAVQERLRALYRSGWLERVRNLPRPTIVEVGAGYGALALAIRRLVPSALYVIVDLPHSLQLAACYLASRQDGEVAVLKGRPPKSGAPFLLCLSTALERIEGLSIDLAINTLSFGEMAEAEVARYAAALRRNLDPDGALIEQNFDNSHLCMPNFCDPARPLRRHFSRRKRIPGNYLKGTPRIWRP